MFIYLKQQKSSFAEGESPVNVVRFEYASKKDLIETLGQYAIDTAWDMATEEEYNEQVKPVEEPIVVENTIDAPIE